MQFKKIVNTRFQFLKSDTKKVNYSIFTLLKTETLAAFKCSVMCDSFIYATGA